MAVDLSKLNDVRAELTTFIGQLQGIMALLQEASNDPSATRESLARFGVSLTVNVPLTEDDWTPDRLTEASAAIGAMIGRISETGDRVLGALQFMQAFGGTEIRLMPGNYEGSASYASTSSDGRTIFLYTAPAILLRADYQRCADGLNLTYQEAELQHQKCVDAGYVLHTEENIVHEFGHVLAFRSGGEMLAEWNQFATLISAVVNPDEGDPNKWEHYFETTLGWGDVFESLQNRSTYRGTVSPIPITNTTERQAALVELENERLANMFQAFVYGYHPMLDEEACPPENPDCVQRRAAWAMWAFMTGECPPDDVFVGRQRPPCGSEVKGILGWIQDVGGKNEE